MPRSLSATPSRRKISMDRAPIWPHFTFGGSLAGRRSATTTSIPRQAKPIASVSPTGPPPTTSTVVFIPPAPALVFVTILVFERPSGKVAQAVSGWEELAHSDRYCDAAIWSLLGVKPILPKRRPHLRVLPLRCARRRTPKNVSPTPYPHCRRRPGRRHYGAGAGAPGFCGRGLRGRATGQRQSARRDHPCGDACN